MWSTLRYILNSRKDKRTSWCRLSFTSSLQNRVHWIFTRSCSDKASHRVYMSSRHGCLSVDRTVNNRFLLWFSRIRDLPSKFAFTFSRQHRRFKINCLSNEMVNKYREEDSPPLAAVLSRQFTLPKHVLWRPDITLCINSGSLYVVQRVRLGSTGRTINCRSCCEGYWTPTCR